MNTNNISALRKRITTFYGDHLPEQIRYRDRDGRKVVIPTMTATLDELAFAIQMASEEQSLASRRRAALDELYITARKSGALGADRLSAISWKEYASFQGRVFLGKRDIAGLPIEVRSPGNVAELKLSLKTDVLEHYESQTGQRSLDHRMVKQKSATVKLTIEEFTKENLALALYGNHVVGTSGSVTAEPIGGVTPTPGDRYFLAHPRVSSLVVTDSGTTPTTLVAGTHYTADPDFGAVQFLDTTGFTAPFKASYAYGVATEIGIFTQALPERFLRMEGINTAQGNAKVLVELYRVAFDPLKEISFISDDYNKFELEGSLLADTTKAYDAVLGQFGRIVQL